MRENPSLYIVPTPIGNLEDITFRAVRILKEVNSILAEDTRKTSQLLRHYHISTPMNSYHAFNEHKTLAHVIAKLKDGETMAMVSDAGTPGISDPGYLLIRECIQQGISIECLPGATAFVPAIVNSGFPTDSFVFEGFLPHKKGRQTMLKRLAEETRTFILYESPHRLLKTLEQFKEYLGPQRKICISRELSKMFEENIRATVEEAIVYFSAKAIKGEIVIVVEGKIKE